MSIHEILASPFYWVVVITGLAFLFVITVMVERAAYNALKRWSEEERQQGRAPNLKGKR